MFLSCFWRGFGANEMTIVQCPNEKCRNDEAYWYQLQIRSADEPMTAFYKVSRLLIHPLNHQTTYHLPSNLLPRMPLTQHSAQSAQKSGENELGTMAFA